MVATGLKLVQPMTRADVEAALRDVEAACSCETANLLKAVFAGFQLLADGARLRTEIVNGVDEAGKACLFLVVRFPEAGQGGGAIPGDGLG